MNINNLKSEISTKIGKSIPTLMMVRQMEQEKNAEGKEVPTPWLSHWDNDTRVRIAMHEDVFKHLIANPTVDTLAYKVSTKPATDTTLPYTIYTVIIPAKIEGTF